MQLFGVINMQSNYYYLQKFNYRICVRIWIAFFYNSIIFDLLLINISYFRTVLTVFDSQNTFDKDNITLIK